MPPISAEALGLLEIDGLPRALRAQDAALKRAPCKVLACAPVSDGKAILILAGDVASVEESMAAAEGILESRRLDRLFLPGVHPAVVASLYGERKPRQGSALGALELTTAAATLELADVAVKMAKVEIGRLHLATGFGGKGYFTIFGEQAEVEAAMEAAVDHGRARVLDYEIIAAPHEELDDAAFLRPWGLDPADT